MGLDNPLHIFFLLVILLLVFGAKRLPELGRSLGTGMRGFKETVSGEGHPGHSEHPEHPGNSGHSGQVEQLSAASSEPVSLPPLSEPAPERVAVRPAA